MHSSSSQTSSSKGTRKLNKLCSTIEPVLARYISVFCASDLVHVPLPLTSRLTKGQGVRAPQTFARCYDISPRSSVCVVLMIWRECVRASGAPDRFLNTENAVFILFILFKLGFGCVLLVRRRGGADSPDCSTPHHGSRRREVCNTHAH